MRTGFIRARSILAMAAVWACSFPMTAYAVDGAAVAASQCGTCHQMEGSAEDSLQARRERVAPPLYYAGDKFQEAWLTGWLQSPTRVRPAGDFAAAHVESTEEGDVIDTATLPDHPAFDAATASAVAAYLMTLKPNAALIAAVDYTPGTVSPRMGAMDFVKFKGCGACHRDTPADGGVSGPELYTAWQRLQPEFIVSYIDNPTAWDPYSVMPVKHLQAKQIHKLADYLKVIGESKEAAQ